MAELVAKTYSEALFAVAKEDGSIETIFEEFKSVVAIFNNEPTFYDLYQAPVINNEERKSMVKEVFEGKISPELLNFMLVLIDKGRTTQFTRIFKAFNELYDDYKGYLNVTVESAIELKEEEQEALKHQLDKLTGKDCKLTAIVEPSIIGGMVVKVGDKIIDGSIQSKLKGLHDSLSQILV